MRVSYRHSSFSCTRNYQQEQSAGVSSGIKSTLAKHNTPSSKIGLRRSKDLTHSSKILSQLSRGICLRGRRLVTAAVATEIIANLSKIICYQSHNYRARQESSKLPSRDYSPAGSPQTASRTPHTSSQSHEGRQLPASFDRPLLPPRFWSRL